MEQLVLGADGAVGRCVRFEAKSTGRVVAARKERRARSCVLCPSALASACTGHVWCVWRCGLLRRDFAPYLELCALWTGTLDPGDDGPPVRVVLVVQPGATSTRALSRDVQAFAVANGKVSPCVVVGDGGTYVGVVGEERSVRALVSRLGGVTRVMSSIFRA